MRIRDLPALRKRLLAGLARPEGRLLLLLGMLWGLLLARLPLPEGGTLTLLAAVGVGSLLEPLVGVGAALLFGPLQAWLRAEFPHVPPLLGQYLFALAVAGWGLRGLRRRTLRLPTPPLLAPLLGFVGVALLSLWSSADAWVGFLEWTKWGQILLVFLITYDRLKTSTGIDLPAFLSASSRRGRDSRWLLLTFLCLAPLLQSGVGLWQFALRGTGPDHFLIREALYRAYGTFEQPNPYGGFIGMYAALLVGLIAAPLVERWTDGTSLPRWFWPLALVLAPIGAALGASWSRGAWMGFGAALLAITARLPRRGLWGIVLVALVVVGGAGLYLTGRLPPAVADRLTGFLAYLRFEDVRGAPINDANYAVLERLAHWQAALEMWRDHFWLGVGFGCYEPAYPDYALINWPFALGHAHNYYLNLLAETGVLGLLAYLGLLGALLARLWRLTRTQRGWRRGLALGLLGTSVHLAVHSLVDNLLVNNVHLFVGVLLALAAWIDD
ncbi:MAG: O-antigen ligase family protein [Anaerolineae bacterium]